MPQDYHITMDSFGSDLQNWQEVADCLNEVIDETLRRMGDNAFDLGGNLTPDARDAIDSIWESWCGGEMENCPKPVMED